jgi:hypothetical protein
MLDFCNYLTSWRWQGLPSSTLPRLQTAIISNKVLNQDNGALCLSKMLVLSLHELLPLLQAAVMSGKVLGYYKSSLRSYFGLWDRLRQKGGRRSCRCLIIRMSSFDSSTERTQQYPLH